MQQDLTGNGVANVFEGLLLFRAPSPVLGIDDRSQWSDAVRPVAPQLMIEIYKAEETAELALVSWFREGKQGQDLLLLWFNTF